jgi:hypothetical protein
VKLLYAIAFALFPLAAPAQTPNSSLLTALCHNDYYEDTSGQCSAISAGDVLPIDVILERYGAVVIARDADEDIAGAFLADREETPIGSINPPSEIPENSGTEPTVGVETVASHIVAPEAQLQTNAEGEDDIVATGPTVRRIPAVATEPIPDDMAVE